MAQTFKTATMGGGYGTFGSNVNTLRDFVMQNPELLQQIGGERALDAYIKEQQAFAMGGFGGENGLQVSADTQRIDDILNNYQMNSIGYAGMDDGRQKAIVKDGQTLFTGDPYSYKPAKDNLETAIRGAALIGGTAGLSSLVNGGMLGAGSQGTSAIQGGSGWLDSAVASDLAASQAAAVGQMGAGAGLTAGELAALGVGGSAAGGAAGAAAGSATGGMGSSASGALGGLLDFAKANPKLAGAVLGGLLGGTSGGSGGGYKYNGPMPTISREGWNPNARARMMNTRSVVQGLPQAQGQQYSGLLRFLGG